MEKYDDCASYLSHIQSEHNLLELLSKNVADQFGQSLDNNRNEVDRPEIAARLGALRDELSKHIDEEEQGGCIDEAVSRLPSLSLAAKEIYQEHDVLKDKLVRVMQLVEFGSWDVARKVFLEFSAELRLHERREEQLIAKGLNIFEVEE